MHFAQKAAAGGYFGRKPTREDVHDENMGTHGRWRADKGQDKKKKNMWK